MATETERAWAAGFFDGEGSVARTKSKKPGRCGVPQVAITQAGDSGVPEALSRFVRAVGVEARIYGPIRIKGRKDRYQLQIGRDVDVRAVRDALWPYLSSVKRDAFTTRLAEYDAQAPLPKGLKRTHCDGPAKHLLTPDNVYWSRGGKCRRCKTCQLQASRVRRTALRPLNATG